MDRYKYNEVIKAKMIYENGFHGKYRRTDLQMLVLYMRDYLNLKPIKIKEELDIWCKKHYIGFNIARDYDIFNKMINYAKNKNNKLIYIEKISIYEEEFNYIKSLQIEHVYKKFLFAFLVKIKYNKSSNFIRKGYEPIYTIFQGDPKKYKEIKDISKTPENLKVHEDIIHALNEVGLLESTFKGQIIVHFVKNIPEIKSESPMFYVTRYDLSGWYFDYYCGGNRIKLCKECNEPFYMKSNSQEYCEDHKPLYEPMLTKTICCIDCGKSFEVDTKANNRLRCDSCNNRERTKINARYYKNKLKD